MIVLGTGTWTQMKWGWPRDRMEEARAESHGDKPSRLTSVVGKQWGATGAFQERCRYRDNAWRPVTLSVFLP